MNSVTGKVTYSIHNQRVSSIDELPHQDFSEIQARLISWRRKLSEEMIKEHLKKHAPEHSIQWNWEQRK